MTDEPAGGSATGPDGTATTKIPGPSADDFQPDVAADDFQPDVPGDDFGAGMPEVPEVPR